MNTDNNRNIRPEKLLLQTYASGLQRFLRSCRNRWNNIPLRLRQLIFVLLGIAVAVALILKYVLDRSEVQEVLPVVVVETVKTENVNIYGEYAGRIRAQQFVEIRARVEGYLEKMLFTEGTYIQKGQYSFHYQSAALSSSCKPCQSPAQ